MHQQPQNVSPMMTMLNRCACGIGFIIAFLSLPFLILNILPQVQMFFVGYIDRTFALVAGWIVIVILAITLSNLIAGLLQGLLMMLFRVGSRSFGRRF